MITTNSKLVQSSAPGLEAPSEPMEAGGQGGIVQSAPQAVEHLQWEPTRSAATTERINWAQQPDEKLIRACLSGDREAWAALLERYSRLIYSIAWKSNLPPEDVADVFQSTVLTLLEELGNLKDQTKLSSWLTTVTIHQCLRVKRRRTRPLISLQEAQEQVINIPDQSLLPDEMIQCLERQQLVRQALVMLDEPCRRLLIRLFFEDEAWSYEQISGELRLSVSTIGPKRGRCLKRLLQILTKLGF